MTSKEDWKELFAPTEACPELEELGLFLSRSLPEPARARVAAHSAACPRCQTELAMLKEFQSATPRLDERAAVNWIKAQLEERLERKPGSPPLRAAPPPRDEPNALGSWWLVLLGRRPASVAAWAFATVLVVVAAGQYLRNGREPSLSHDSVKDFEVLRSDALNLSGPAGDVEQVPAELRWETVPRAALYAVELMEVDRARLWAAESREDRIALPPAVRAMIVPGKTLLWQVVALDAAGKKVAGSQMQRFRVVSTAPKPQK